MQRALQPDDLMAILDGIDDAVVKLDGQAGFRRHESGSSRDLSAIRTRPSKHEREIRLGTVSGSKGTLVEEELRFKCLEDHVQVKLRGILTLKISIGTKQKAIPASPGAILVFRDITAIKTSSALS